MTDNSSAKTEDMSSSAVTEGKSSMTLIIIVLVVVVLGVVALVALMLTGTLELSGSSDDGTDIPSNYQTYTGNGYEVGYPEGWQKFSLFGITMFAPEAIGAEPTDAVLVFVDKKEVFAESDENAEEEFAMVADGKCDDLNDEDITSLAEGTSDVEITKTKSVKVNGVSACRFDLKYVQNDEDGQATAYFVVNDEVAGVLMIMAVDGDNYDDGLKAIQSFMINPDAEAEEGTLDDFLNQFQDESGNQLDDADLDGLFSE